MISPLWQAVAAYVFALTGGSISTSLRLTHKPLCALISFAAGTLLGVTLFAIAPESLNAANWWAAMLAAATGYAVFFFISKYVHHVCPACAASHFDADSTRHFSEIATALMIARLWRGYSTPDNAKGYRQILLTETLPGLRKTNGHGGSFLLERKTDHETEFLVITLWESMDAVRQFAGPDYDVAVIHEEAAAFLTRYNTKSLHYAFYESK
jgi:hypothetical protein